MFHQTKMSVLLVIKTPNQKHEDLTVTSETTWTVLQLKQHLQQFYPTRPKVEEQRLIYSGKLLSDNQVLQEFLRDLDSEQTHTIHLVYMGTKIHSSEMGGRNTEQNEDIANEGVRQRINSRPMQYQGYWVSNGQFPILANQVADPVTQQLLWWQQTYAQQYWAQYMQYMSNSHTQAVPLATPPTPPTPPPNQNRVQEAPRPALGVDVAPEDEDGGLRRARDWLDWAYIGSRLAILVAVIYYYSSPSRFMLVALIAVGIYFYQKTVRTRQGVRVIQEVNNNVNRNAADNPEANEAVPNDGQVNTDTIPVTNPSKLAIIVNLFLGFFGSLIPEVPPPEAIN